MINTQTKTPKPNPTLHNLEILVGEWDVEMAFPDSPSTVHGEATFTWLDDGAFLRMQMGDKTSDLPWSICMIGRDDSVETYSMLYYDWRGVSRIYQMSLENGKWKQWRESPGFHQRFTGTFSKDRNSITAKWEKSSDGSNWEHDFDLKYGRK